jgi:hypothetical protein
MTDRYVHDEERLAVDAVRILKLDREAMEARDALLRPIRDLVRAHIGTGR